MTSGIYQMTYEQYEGVPAASKHLLDSLAISPLHCWAYNINPERGKKKETPASILGSAIHVSILEPERFEKEYVREPNKKDYFISKYEGAKKCPILDTLDDYKKACKQLDLPVSGTKTKLKNDLLGAGYLPNEFWDELYESLTFGRKVLSDDDWRITRAITSRVRKHPAAIDVLMNGKAEQSLFWTDKETGVLCKGRMDWLNHPNMILDLKSTMDASPEGFQRSISKYRYYIQAAMYVDGLQQITGLTETFFIFAAWEKCAPYASALYYATPAMLESGRIEYKRLLRIYAKCLESDTWPGYSQEIMPIDMPQNYKSSSLSELPEED